MLLNAAGRNRIHGGLKNSWKIRASGEQEMSAAEDENPADPAGLFRTGQDSTISFA
jgi:hypothetical protein